MAYYLNKRHEQLMITGKSVKIFSTKKSKLEVKTLMQAEIIALDYGFDKADYLTRESFVPYNHRDWLMKSEDERFDIGSRYHHRDDLHIYYSDLAHLFKGLGCDEIALKCRIKSFFQHYMGAQYQWQLPNFEFESLHATLLKQGREDAAKRLTRFHLRTFCNLPCEA